MTVEVLKMLWKDNFKFAEHCPLIEAALSDKTCLMPLGGSGSFSHSRFSFESRRDL